MTAADRHLLLGLLALQNGLIDQAQLIVAFQAWMRDRHRSLADHLEARGDLTGAKRALLEELARIHLEAHGGDMEKSLAAISAAKSTRESLARLGEPELDTSLGHLGLTHRSAEDGDTDRTTTYAVGTATSDGQRFRVLRPHARGGLGAVFVALDEELHREVALKQMLDQHADDPTSRQRFLIEAEVTGSLEHPGIVPVYGLGIYGDGRPYYAMRFIRGDSLKEAVDHFHADEGLKKDHGLRSLELRKLLRRFMDVCNAIDYAHSRGVLHRDIKPGNIIVGKHGETLVVDWGLAKATGKSEPGAEERTLMPSSASGSAETLPGSALGTPAYMSPEQACGELERLGPRSDVYSLGATLYCLLTGKPPQEGDDIGEMLRKVQRGEFIPPRQLDSSIDKALEAVCLKAMGLRPEDRYVSCRAVAEDIERWMADESVSAWQEPWTRKLLRWLTRHRTGVTGTAAAVLAGVVGLTAVLFVQSAANASLSASLSRETNANAALNAANAELTRSKAAVQARYDLAVDAIKTFHTGVSEDFLLKEEKFKELRNNLLKSASDFYGKLSSLLGKETDVASRRALAQSNFELADLTRKVGRQEDALAAHRAVLASREALVAEVGASAETIADVGRSLTAIGHLLDSTGQSIEAEASYRKAESLLKDQTGLLTASPTVRAALADCRSRLGDLLSSKGKIDDALTSYRLARADQTSLATDSAASNVARSELGRTVSRIAVLLAEAGKSAEAETEFRESLAIYRKLTIDNPAVSDFQSKLALGCSNFGFFLVETDKPVEAEAELRESLAIYEKLTKHNPAVTKFHWGRALVHNNLGNLQSKNGKPAEAEAEYRESLEIYRKLVDDNPTDTDFRRRLAYNHLELGSLLSDKGKPGEGYTEFLEALALEQRLADDNPTITSFQRELAECLLGIGWQLAKSGKYGEAIKYYTREEAVRRKLAGAESARPDDTDSLANCQTNMADLYRKARRKDEALAACARACALREPLVRDHPLVTSFRGGLAETYLRTGQVHSDAGNLVAASAAWKKAVTVFDGLKSPRGQVAFLRSCCHAGLAGLGCRPNSGISAREGQDESERAMRWLSRAVEFGYRNADAYRTEDALDPLRKRDDFQLLLLDLAFPAEPFDQ